MPDPVVGGLGVVPPMVRGTKYHGLVYPPPPPKIQFIGKHIKKTNGIPPPPRIQIVDPHMTDRRRMAAADMQSMQTMIDRLHDDNRNDALMTLREKRRLDRHFRLETIAETYGVGQYAQDSFEVSDVKDDEGFGFHLSTKCTLFVGSNNQVFELCIGSNGIDIRHLDRIQSEQGANLTVNETNDGYLDYMDFELMKYGLMANVTPIDLMNKDLIGCHHLQTRRFIYDFDTNHRRQCWDSLYELQLCLQLEDDQMQMNIVSEHAEKSERSRTFQFSKDSDWIAVTIANNDAETIRKCTSVFDAKICLQLRMSVYTAIVFTYSPEISI